MMTHEVDPELIPLIEARIKRDRAQLSRQRHAVDVTVRDLHHCIREGLEHGMSPTHLAKLAGLHVSRIYQIRDTDDSALL